MLFLDVSYQKHSLTLIAAVKMNKNELVNYYKKINALSSVEFEKERLQILWLIDGDIFYHLRMWPTELRRRFFRKPNTDQDTMVLFLFFLGKRDSYALVH